MTIIFFAFLSFVLSCVLLLFGRILARRFGLTDQPGGRKTHSDPIPLIGGLVIIPVFALFSSLYGESGNHWVVISAAGFLMLMGAWDDVVPLHPYMKFALQVFTGCFVVVFGELQVDSLGNLFGFGEVQLGWIAKPFTVMAFVLFMNALNMIDGLDGLAGGLSFVMLFFLLLCALGGNADYESILILFLMAPLAAFLIFNMRYPGHKKASVFLGDAGSLALGLLIAWFAITLSQEPGKVLSPSVVPWIIGLPVIDAFALYIMRTMTGHKPFEPDRNHLHHRFLEGGVPAGKVTMIILCFSATTAALALLAHQIGVPEWFIFFVWAGLFFVHMAMVFRPQRYAALFRCFS